MISTKHVQAALVAVATVLLIPAAADAQEQYIFTVGVLGGLGGSLDSSAGDDIGNAGFQLNLTMVTEPDTHVGFRLGNLALDADDPFGALANADLTYLTVGGEYRYDHSFYESGVFVGLGGYQLAGDDIFTGQSVDDTSVGIVLGLTGEFQLTRRLAFLIEIAGHWADLEEAQTFVTAHGGLAIHF